MPQIPSGRYKVACGRIVGRAHVSAQMPCQDFVWARRNSEMGCVALADGAGSRAKSEVGAEVVVRTLLRMLSSKFDEIYEMCDESNDAPQRIILGGLLKSLSRAAKRNKCAVDALASTLLFVASKGGRFVAGHIGDGVIARIDAVGAAHTLTYPDNGEFANSTVFITDPVAAKRFRLVRGLIETGGTGFVLMSDGSAESLYDKRANAPVPAISKLHAWNQELSRKKMESVLLDNLEQNFSKKSSDDCSIGILSVSEASR